MSVNSTSMSPSPSPTNLSNAPKFGTRIPNRIFVGGIPTTTTEAELYDLFSTFGCVSAAKVIADRAGVSKGYGFVTFETEEDAEKALKEKCVILKDRKLNVAPAIRKQPFFGIYGSPDIGSDRSSSVSRITPRATPDWNVTSPEPSQLVPNGTVFYHSGTPYAAYPNGMIFASTDGTCQFSQPAQAYYPMIYSPAVYLPPQQYQYQSPVTSHAQWAGQQVRWTATAAATAQPVNYAQNPTSHTSAAASSPQFVYATNGGTSTSSGVGGGSTHSTINNTATNGTVVNAAAYPTQSAASAGAGGDSTTGVSQNGPAMLTYAYAYASPPLMPHAPYQPQTGGQHNDLVGAHMMEATPAESTSSHTQGSMGTTDSRVVHTGRPSFNRFSRPPPPSVQQQQQHHHLTNQHHHQPHHHQMPICEEHHHPPPHHRYVPTTYDYGNGGKAFHRGTSLSPRKSYGGGGIRHSSSSAHYTSPQHQQQQHYNQRPRPFKSMTSYVGNGNVKGPLTPPPTPMAGDGPVVVAATEVADTAKKLETLNL